VGAPGSAGEVDGVINDGGCRHAIEMEQLVEAKAKHEHNGGVDAGELSVSRIDDKVIEPSLPPEGSNYNLRGQRLVTKVSEARATLRQSRRQVFSAVLDCAQRIERGGSSRCDHELLKRSPGAIGCPAR
jgi:hypothetical protein